ncbi:VanZ family protein [Priestia megaterium]|uniref:VanZ family protein n=1 Tax=Priestia megaterium TaxID=1404 RepID=UPI00207A0CC9|nr:VanZ family protein [Priestia megaterium]MCJ7992216.1 VanZ family protein [Priestia sp. OVS21]USL37380.1 VanZ family protein [Priestia megaterium]
MFKRNVINVLFLGSILFIIGLTMFPEASLGIGVDQGGINLVPFYTIGDLLLHRSFGDFIINNMGNIILFIPLGTLLPFKFNSISSFSKVCLIGMAFSLLIEIVQLSMPNRWTDIDDVILNTLGTGIGYGLSKLLKNISKTA